MKGLTHFLMGVMIVSFIGSAMQGVVLETSLILMMGAFFGLLPDTMDFKFNRYIETHHKVVDPHPDEFDPQEIAEATAEEIDKAAELDPGDERKITYHTMKVGPDLWQSYAPFFDTRKKEVRVRKGPKSDTGQNMIAGTEPSEDEKIVGKASFDADLEDPFGRPTDVASFSGPSYGFRKREDEKVEVIFLPWHRRNGHSVTMGAFFAAIVYLLFSFFNIGSLPPYVYALATFSPWLVHVLLDQFGHMGNNLFWPFTRHRKSGGGLVSASDPYWNFFVDYSCIALVFFNMNRAAADWLTPTNMGFSADVSIWYYSLLVIVIPMAILGSLFLIWKAYFKEGSEPEPEVKSPATQIMERLPEEQQAEVETRPVPPLLLRIMPLVALAGTLLFFIEFGWML